MKIKKSPPFFIPVVIMLTGFSAPLFASSKAIEPPMVTIPAGTFLMGNHNGRANELPVHKVNIATFQMAKYEVTVKEYGQFIKATGYAPAGKYGDICVAWERKTKQSNSYGFSSAKGTWDNTFIDQNGFHPVLCISNEDIQAYTSWLVTETGKPYRLPSEAEWEYAARAGTTSKYFFGDDESELCRFGNVFDQTGNMAFKQQFLLEGIYAQCDDKVKFTSVVGMYQANAYGLYDTIGNVGEIVADCEHKNYQGAPNDGSAWTSECSLNPAPNKMIIHRGGDYGLWSAPSSLGSSTRGHIGPYLRSSLGEGFRLALDGPNEKMAKLPMSTVAFSEALSVAQKQETLRRKALTPFPDKPMKLTLKHNTVNGSYTLSWQENLKQKSVKYNVYKSETIGGKYVLIAEGINQLQFTDSTVHSRKHSYVVTASNGKKESIYSDKVLTKNVMKSSQAIVQAEDFNHMYNVEIGVVTDKEEVGGGLNLTGAGGINKGNWVEYLINIESSNFYKLNYRIASADGSDGFELVLNGDVKARFSIPTTGGWRKWQTASGDKMYIEAGQYKVRLKAIASGWKLNWFSFVVTEPVS